jgi:hypothetical protein
MVGVAVLTAVVSNVYPLPQAAGYRSWRGARRASAASQGQRASRRTNLNSREMGVRNSLSLCDWVDMGTSGVFV